MAALGNTMHKKCMPQIIGLWTSVRISNDFEIFYGTSSNLGPDSGQNPIDEQKQ